MILRSRARLLVQVSVCRPRARGKEVTRIFPQLGKHHVARARVEGMLSASRLNKGLVKVRGEPSTMSSVRVCVEG